MVTILPIDVDEDLLREGLQIAVAQRLQAALEVLEDLAKELRAGNLIGRAEWSLAFEALISARETFEPLLEYADSFCDPDLSGEGDSGVAE